MDTNEQEARDFVERQTSPGVDPATALENVMEGGILTALFGIRTMAAAMSEYADPDNITSDEHKEICRQTLQPAQAELEKAVETVLEAVQELVWKMYECNCLDCQRQARADAAPFN